MTPTEIVLARYGVLERETDTLGRVIAVQKLRPSQQVKLNELTPMLEGGSVIHPAEGVSFTISHRSPMSLAAAVREIDGSPIPFPKTRAELDSTLDALGEEGSAAAFIAFLRIVQDGAPGGEVVEAAKN